MLGVLGGMGPLATADFLAKLVDATDAACDQEHIPVLVYGDPRVPDRTRAILHGGDSPVPAMLAGLRVLETCAVTAIAIPCNTAHYWLPTLAEAVRTPIISMIDAVDAEIEALGPVDGPIGVLATAGTLSAGIYQDMLTRSGRACCVPSAAAMESLVTPGIGLVKAGRIAPGRERLAAAADGLTAQGAQAIVLGCTEIAAVLKGSDGPDRTPVVDSTLALARACARIIKQGRYR
jgi:aspartate racemase